MKALIKSNKQKLTFLLIGALTSINPAMANTDMKAMADVQKAREMGRKNVDHSQHQKPVDASQKFRGVYYGYLPCKTCAGIKMTLSLKNKKNYLLVTQYAQASNREHFEKGKYDWDDKTNTVTLKARKKDKIQKLRIKDNSTLIMLSPEGKAMPGKQDQYALVRSDKNKSRELHIH